MQTPVFEGPFDVLLHLITKQQVELYEVSIVTIVDGFLKHLSAVQASGEMDLESTTEFLLIAATLVELKTRRLLPEPADIDLDEELALWEERDLLLARLVECKTFKDAAIALVAMEDAAKLTYPRRAGMEEHFLKLSPDPLTGMSPEKLRKAFIRATAPKPEPPKVSLSHVTQVKITIQEAMEHVVDKVSSNKHMTFRNLTQKFDEPMEVIVTFLGLLELYKQGLIDLEQAVTFGDLNVSWLGEESDAIIDIRERALVDAYEG